MNSTVIKEENVGIVKVAPVVGIQNDNASVKILAYLKEKKRKSENTYVAYVRYYSEFFQYACNKEISQIDWEDIFSVTYSTIDEYKSHMLDKGYSMNTAMQKILSIKSLWRKLHAINNNVDYQSIFFNLEKEEIEVNSYASLTDKEMELLLNFMDTEEYKPLTKRLFFEFLYTIGCRKNAALKLEWSQIIKKKDPRIGIDVWVAGFRDKGKTIEKAINNDFMKRLFKLKETGESKGDRVFDISQDSIEKVFDNFQEKYNLYKVDGKKVVIHSVKKAGAWRVQNTFGDINKTKKFCQHKNIQLTASVYASEENYTDQASYMIGKNIDIDFFKELSKDELIKLIQRSGKDVQTKMFYEWEKISEENRG